MKIKICTTCEGEGEYKVNIPSHNNNYYMKTCTRCNATGKVIECTTHLTAEIPFTKDPQVLYTWNSKVIDVSRNLKKELNIID